MKTLFYKNALINHLELPIICTNIVISRKTYKRTFYKCIDDIFFSRNGPINVKPKVGEGVG